MKPSYLSLITYLLLMAISCTRTVDKRLEAINTCLNENPRQSIDMRSALDSIDSSTLSESDKIYKALLTIKIRDLNLEQHSSDSLIKRVLNYVNSHQTVSYYCEALYYGGRVYHNLGDYPTALSYYQKTLSQIQTCSDSAMMLGKIYAQMGGLLDRMRLYDEAIPIYEKVIEQDKIRGDSVNEVNDLVYLGNIHLRRKNPLEAKKHFQEALEKCKFMESNINAKIGIYLGYAFMQLNQIDSALYYIRKSIDSVDGYTRGTALSYSVQIYSAANIKDTALYYAKALLRDTIEKHRLPAYRLLLSKEYKEYIPDDTLREYVVEYHRLLDKGYNFNQAEFVMLRQNVYNYDMHERARKDLEIQNQRLLNERLWCFVVILLLGGTLIYIKYRNKKRKSQLQTSLTNVRALGFSLYNKPVLMLTSCHPHTDKTTQTELLNELKESVRKIAEDSEPVDLSPQIIGSEVYQEIKTHIDEGKMIDKKSEIWKRLNEVIHQVSPEFQYRLNLLTSGKITDNEYRTACLIKIHIPPVKIGVLFDRSKTAIGSRRESIGKKIYGKKIGVELVDKIIRKL